LKANLKDLQFYNCMQKAAPPGAAFLCLVFSYLPLRSVPPPRLLPPPPPPDGLDGRDGLEGLLEDLELLLKELLEGRDGLLDGLELPKIIGLDFLLRG